MITKEMVKKLRDDLELTQAQFGDLLFVSPKTVQSWEQGRHEMREIYYERAMDQLSWNAGIVRMHVGVELCELIREKAGR